MSTVHIFFAYKKWVINNYNNSSHGIDEKYNAFLISDRTLNRFKKKEITI